MDLFSFLVEGEVISNKETGFSLSDDDFVGGGFREGRSSVGASSRGNYRKISGKFSGIHKVFSWVISCFRSLKCRVVVLLTILLGVFGLWLNQFYEQIEFQKEQLQLVSKELHTMEGTVVETSKSIDRTDLEAKSELKGVNLEIRKLWDVSNKRNRRWIEENKEAIVELEKKFTSSSNTLTGVVKELKKIEGMVEGQEKLAKQIKGVSIELLGEVAKLSALREQVDSVKDKLEKLERNFKNHQEAIDAMDIFKRQVNNKVQQMESMLRKVTEGT